jgi:hypothetical protein
MSARHYWVLIPSALITCWLGMMLVHEFGHMAMALCSGGTVQKLVFHPLAFSRTDVDPNPHPMAVAWAGPAFGGTVPAGVVWLMGRLRRRSYLLEVFAAFCLLANGAYLSFGSLERTGDAGDLQRLGMPMWALWISGSGMLTWGLWQFHRFGPALGMRQRATKADAWAAAGIAVILIAVGLWIDGR